LKRVCISYSQKSFFRCWVVPSPKDKERKIFQKEGGIYIKVKNSGTLLD
jgi:hypothetical protein